MDQDVKPRRGGQILVDQLVAQEVEHVFCVPGESYLAVLDALHDSPIALTVCRQEGGAAMMADASARLTGRPGVVMVTRGPGATNAAHGLHIAEHDSVPLVLFIGQVERGMRGRGAFQEMDYGAFFGRIAKAVLVADDPARLPELVSRAFHLALQGRPGPVVIELPEDMLVEEAAVADAPRVEPVLAWPGLTQMAALQKRLWAARRPILVLGGSGWSARACATVARFAERFALPVATSFRRAALFDARHPLYAGEIGIGPNPALKARLEAADLVILLGGRMAEMPSQSYTLLAIPTTPPGARPHPCRSERDRPCLPPPSRHPGLAGDGRGRAGKRAAAPGDPVGRGRGSRPRGLPGLERGRAARGRAGRHGSRDAAPCATTCRTRRL